MPLEPGAGQEALIERAEIKAAMIEMGEKIAWGSDSAIIRELVAALKAAQVDLAAACAELDDADKQIEELIKEKAAYNRALVAAETGNARLMGVLRTIHDKFANDETQGYRSRDRQYAIAMIRPLLAGKEG